MSGIILSSVELRISKGLFHAPTLNLARDEAKSIYLESNEGALVPFGNWLILLIGFPYHYTVIEII